MRRLLTALGVGVFACSLTVGARVTWPVANGGNGHDYEGVSGYISWNQANAMAQSMGGTLVTITSQAEMDFVFETVGSDPSLWIQTGFATDGPWIGGYQPNPSVPPADGWAWVTGEPFAYSNWAAGQPDDYSGDNRDAIHLWGGLGAAPISPKWDDVGRIQFMNGFIVEYIPEPATLVLLTLTTALRRRSA